METTKPTGEWTAEYVVMMMQGSQHNTPYGDIAKCHNAALAVRQQHIDNLDAALAAEADGWRKAMSAAADLAKQTFDDKDKQLAAARGALEGYIKSVNHADRHNAKWQQRAEKAEQQLAAEQIERCEVCNTELSQCGTQGVDGEPSLDCLVCKLREQIAAERKKVAELEQRLKGYDELPSV